MTRKYLMDDSIVKVIRNGKCVYRGIWDECPYHDCELTSETTTIGTRVRYSWGIVNPNTGKVEATLKLV